MGFVPTYCSRSGEKKQAANPDSIIMLLLLEEHPPDGEEHDPDVEERVPMGDVIEIELHPFAKG
jgi:hypothetical protein